MSKRRTKPDGLKIEKYGRGEVLTDCQEPDPNRELWCGVILQAIVNCRFKVPNWQSSYRFLKGNGNFKWICEQLDIDYERASKNALKAALISKRKINKH